MKKLLYWAPRILCILFGVFLSLFSLDVFEAGRGVGDTLLGLMIHLAPVFLIYLILVVSWRREWVGALLFAALAVFYVAATKGREHWGAYAGISGSLAVISALFLVNWMRRKG